MQWPGAIVRTGHLPAPPEEDRPVAFLVFLSIVTGTLSFVALFRPFKLRWLSTRKRAFVVWVASWLLLFASVPPEEGPGTSPPSSSTAISPAQTPREPSPEPEPPRRQVVAGLRTIECTTLEGKAGELELFVARTSSSSLGQAFPWGELCGIADDVDVQHALVSVRLRPGMAEALCSDPADGEEGLLATYTSWRALIGNLANIRIRNADSREIAQIWPSRFIDGDMTGRVEWKC